MAGGGMARRGAGMAAPRPAPPPQPTGVPVGAARPPPQADYAVHPTTPWNYALVLPGPERAIHGAFGVRESPVGPVPFAPESAPVTLTAKARRLPEWALDPNPAG